MKYKQHKPIILTILDGFGEWETSMGNPMTCAKMPFINHLNQYYPKIFLEASGLSVGLPWGVFGNSEVGHQTMGSGQIMYHYYPTITMSIQSGDFYKEKVLLKIADFVKTKKSSLHLIGLVSDGGVHSHISHLIALLKFAKQQNIENVFIHAITDGRDTSPKSSTEYLKIIIKNINEIGVGKIATVVGRYYAMDRNLNWDRIEKTYCTYTEGIGIKEKDPIQAILKQYDKNRTDEFLEPVVIVNKKNNPVGLIKENDAVLFFNFRGDRTRQIMKVFLLDGAKYLKKSKPVKNIYISSFVKYKEDLNTDVLFPPQKITTRVGEILSKNNKKQLRIAETEKFAHVTYFFNGALSHAFEGEDRIFIPSKNVKTYAEAPEMSAYEITEKLIKAIQSQKYDFIVVNYANTDMVGHSGNFKAGIKALETVDNCLSKIIKETLKVNGCLLVTADHGNIEEMINLETGEIDTKHSTNPVPLWLVSEKNKRKSKQTKKIPIEINGILADIAPTILDLFGIKTPKEMIGDSLLLKLEKYYNQVVFRKY